MIYYQYANNLSSTIKESRDLNWSDLKYLYFFNLFGIFNGGDIAGIK